MASNLITPARRSITWPLVLRPLRLVHLSYSQRLRPPSALVGTEPRAFLDDPSDPGEVALHGGGGHTPEPRRPVPRPRRDDPPVRVECHAEHGVGVVQRRAELAARPDVPESRRGV